MLSLRNHASFCSIPKACCQRRHVAQRSKRASHVLNGKQPNPKIRELKKMYRDYYYYYYKCHGLQCCHYCGGTLQNQDIKLLHSSMQTSADHQSRRRQVSHMTDERGETWSPSGLLPTEPSKGRNLHLARQCAVLYCSRTQYNWKMYYSDALVFFSRKSNFIVTITAIFQPFNYNHDFCTFSLNLCSHI